MYIVLLILLELLLFTQTIVNIIKIYDHIEMIRTSKKTADLINGKLDQAFNCQCDGKHFKEEE